jgi:large subunit ribosomal protein L30
MPAAAATSVGGAGASVVRSLFVTLRRSLIGKPWQQVAVARALGLSRRLQTVEHANTAAVRGAVAKVAHLVDVETDARRAARLEEERRDAAVRPAFVVRHSEFFGAGRFASGSLGGGGGASSSSAPR